MFSIGKECAEHFGKCSLQEIKELKDGKRNAPWNSGSVSRKVYLSELVLTFNCKIGLRQKRIQDAVIGSMNSVTGSTAPEDNFQVRLMEEELSLQLNLLHEEFPAPYLFSDAALENDKLSAKVKAAEQEQMIELLEEEGVIESLAICALIALIMLAPQFIA
jgi:hypothetical protein